MTATLLKLCLDNNLSIMEYSVLSILKTIRSDKDVVTFKLARDYGERFNKDLGSKFITLEIKKSLEEKGYLNYPKGYDEKEEFTKKAYDLFVRGMSTFQRLWTSYPPFINLNGKTFIAKSCSYLKMEELFHKLTNNSFDLEDEICRLVEENKDYLSSKLETFIESKGWEALKHRVENKPKINEF